MNEDVEKTNKKLLAEIRVSAFHYLARREHSQKELRDKLSQKFIQKLSKASSETEFDLSTLSELGLLIETVLHKIQAEGLQSDERYAEMLVNTRIRRGYGPIKILHELQQKGVVAELCSALINSQDHEWFTRALEVKEKKFPFTETLTTKEKARQQRFLLYRGFSHEHINKVI